MLSDIILENIKKHPDKVAIIWRSKRFTYSDLGVLIETYKKQLKSYNTRILLKSDSPVFAIAQLIACYITNNTGLIISSDLPATDLNRITETYGFVDFEETALNTAKTFSDNYKLGVLTSGSSGKSKVIFKDNDCWESAFSFQSDIFKVTENDTVFLLDALAYSANLNAAVHALWVGATVCFGSLNEAKSWGIQFIENRITTTFLVPSHLRLLANQEIGNSLKSIVTAGEKLSAKLAQILLQKHPKLLLTEYYGTAELGHITYHQNHEITENPRSVGIAFPDVKITIENQQLYVKSPYVSPEYRKLDTVGDLGSWENGKLVLLGRFGRMFNRRGLNIFAQEIEQRAISYLAVQDAYLLERLIGAQTKLHLIYSRNKNYPPSKNLNKELVTYLRALLPASKCPNRVIEVEELPRLRGGKINESRLIEIVYFPENKEDEIKSKLV